MEWFEEIDIRDIDARITRGGEDLARRGERAQQARVDLEELGDDCQHLAAAFSSITSPTRYRPMRSPTWTCDRCTIKDVVDSIKDKLTGKDR